MSSMASGSDHIDHVKTQVPYALTGAGLAIAGYFLTSVIGLNPLIVLVAGIAAIITIVHIFGKKTDVESLEAVENE